MKKKKKGVSLLFEIFQNFLDINTKELLPLFVLLKTLEFFFLKLKPTKKDHMGIKLQS